MTGPSRRARAEGGRPHSHRVTFSEKEEELIRAAAARQGVAAAAWLADAGLRAAEAVVPGPASAWGPVMQDLMGLREVLMEHRRILRIAGGNLNDVARHANSTGEVHEATLRVHAYLERVVRRIEETVGQVEALTAHARREQLRRQR